MSYDPITLELSDRPVKALHKGGAATAIGAQNLAKVFGIKSVRQTR